MAENSYGDAESSADRESARSTCLHDEMEELIENQSRRLKALLLRLRRENESLKASLQVKEDEVRTLKDELVLMKKKTRAVQVSPATSRPKLMDKTPMFLDMEKGETLNCFINRKIRPDRDFNSKSKEIINKIVQSLQQERSFKIKRILKSGSLGKGTAVKDKSDIDLIIFFNGYRTVQELEVDKARLLTELKEYFKKHWSDDLLFKEMTRFSVQFYLRIDKKDTSHEVDLLPALDIVESDSARHSVYKEMSGLKAEERDHYSPCLSPLQLKFVLSSDRQATPGKVKDLIGLLKYWAKAEPVPVRSYFLELLVIHLWREGGKPQDINLLEYLQRALELLTDCASIGIVFHDYYDVKDYRTDIKKPYLLDPANPFRNVAPFSPRETEAVMRKAQTVLENGSNVQT